MKFDLEHRPHALLQSLGAGERFFKQRLQFARGMLVEGEHDRVLGIEIIVRRPGGAAGRRGDLAHRGCGKAAAAEEVDSGGQDSRARLVAFGSQSSILPVGTAWPGNVRPRPRSLWKTKRLKKCMTPSTSRTTPILSENSSIACRALPTVAVVLK